MTPQTLAAWLAKHSNAPKTALKPIATRLGVPTNYLGAALFAGQLVYENQDRIVEYTSKGTVSMGEFLHAQARQRYGEDHPLTKHLGENVDAISEAFEGTEAEARTFAEFYRQYSTVEREHRLRDQVDREAVGRGVESLADRLPGRDTIPDFPGPFGSNAGDADADDEADEPVEIPVIDAK
ncbi:hypothetical protein [Halorussus litoreus]|uniref:hypothetical protein n=1 Tax=Halorussus litoreus TaxID=1710536 RepID=UPI000E2289C0|nr:hypothetical protein [Halorussus litoreus]